MDQRRSSVTSRRLRAGLTAAALAWVAQPASAQSAQPVLTLESLPTPPAAVADEPRAALPPEVRRWREDALRYEHGEMGYVRNPQRAADLYCRASRHGDAESQYALGWMLMHARGIVRNDAHAAHLFAAAAEQGHVQAANLSREMGAPLGDPPLCLQSPDEPTSATAAAPAGPVVPPGTTLVTMRSGQIVITRGAAVAPAPAAPKALPMPSHAPDAIVNFVKLVAPEYQLEPALVLAVMATESNFNPIAVSPRNAQGLMQLIPDTARRFNVRNILDPTQNIRGGMAYLRWLLAYFEGDVTLALAGYNAGEGAVDRYRGVPPYAETRAYVAKIVDRLGGLRRHPFDAKVASPSQRVALGRSDTVRR